MPVATLEAIACLVLFMFCTRQLMKVPLFSIFHNLRFSCSDQSLSLPAGQFTSCSITLLNKGNSDYCLDHEPLAVPQAVM